VPFRKVKPQQPVVKVRHRLQEAAPPTWAQGNAFRFQAGPAAVRGPEFANEHAGDVPRTNPQSRRYPLPIRGTHVQRLRAQRIGRAHSRHSDAQ
jgi:hypothetical protein